MRIAELNIIIGTNGTGKTTLLRSILQDSKQKVLIVTPDDIEWTDYEAVELNKPEDFVFKGIRRHIFDPSKKGTLKKLEYFKKGILVFDDCRSYFPAQTPPELHQLLIRKRQREADIFAVGHGFTEVPPVFFTFANGIFLFRTTDNIIRRKNCLKDFDKTAGAQVRVNHKAKSDPHYVEYIPFV